MQLTDLPRESLFDGALTRTAVRSDNALVTFNWFQPNLPRVAPHKHPFDQMVLILGGTMVFQVDGEDYELGPWSSIVIPANALHTSWPVGDEVVINIDIFSPIREDYLFLTEHQK